MREYRDKFVAHLDKENEANIPHLNGAQSAVQFYHEVVAGEAQPGDLQVP
jgi:hypothetical protein